MRKTEIIEEIERFGRFLLLRRDLTSKYKPRRFTASGGPSCVCNWSAFWGDGNEFSMCRTHRDEFDINPKHFLIHPFSVISHLMSSEEGRARLADDIHLSQEMVLTDSISIMELERKIGREFPDVPKEKLTIRKMDTPHPGIEWML